MTRVITRTPIVSGFTITSWSYAGLSIGPDGLLYVTNELSGKALTQTVGPLTFTLYTTDSIFSVNPAVGSRTLFARDLVAPEGLRYSASGEFPLYVAEEDIGAGAGRLSRVESDGSHMYTCLPSTCLL